MTFNDFGLEEKILVSLERIGFKAPTPIQAQTIPLIKEKRDVIGLAQTGSGKTAACAIPICDRVDVGKKEIQALIVVPTRELAMQYATEVQKIGKDKHVKVFAICGGEDASMQQSKLKHGVQVLVATPGRLIDFIYSRSIDLSEVETLILDEADEMLSMGFYDDLEFIIQCLVHEHQTLLFSATMPKEIKKIAEQHMVKPREVQLIAEQQSPKAIDHHFLYCEHHHRVTVLNEQMDKLKPQKAIIFCHSRIECERVCRELRRKHRGVDFLHGGLNQQVRTLVTNKFRSGKIHHLVATDVAARGLDISGVTHVFIYHLSDDPDIYVHRAGRTGRFDKAGTVVTLVTRRELPALQKVLKQINCKPIWIGNPPPEGETNQRETGRGPRRGAPRRGSSRRRSPRPPKKKPSE